MKKTLAWFIAITSIVVLMWINTSAAEPSKSERIASSLIQDTSIKAFEVDKDVWVKQTDVKVKIYPKGDSEYWREWEEHIIWVLYAKPDRVFFLVIQYIYHKRSIYAGIDTNISRLTMYGSKDDELLGARRSFHILLDEGGVCEPDYPAGFVNLEWHNPSLDEVQSRYWSELTFWSVKRLGKGAI